MATKPDGHKKTPRAKSKWLVDPNGDPTCHGLEQSSTELPWIRITPVSLSGLVFLWSLLRGLNPGPLPYHGSALPLS